LKKAKAEEKKSGGRRGEGEMERLSDRETGRKVKVSELES